MQIIEKKRHKREKKLSIKAVPFFSLGQWCIGVMSRRRCPHATSFWPHTWVIGSLKIEKRMHVRRKLSTFKYYFTFYLFSAPIKAFCLPLSGPGVSLTPPSSMWSTPSPPSLSPSLYNCRIVCVLGFTITTISAFVWTNALAYLRQYYEKIKLIMCQYMLKNF